MAIIKVKCIKPTKYLEKDKEYLAKTKEVYQGRYNEYVGSAYGERYIIKIHEHLTLTVSPKRFKILC